MIRFPLFKTAAKLIVFRSLKAVTLKQIANLLKTDFSTFQAKFKCKYFYDSSYEMHNLNSEQQ